MALIYNHHYRSTCYLPLFIFDGPSGALVAALLRPGKSPTGAENAMIMRCVLTQIRRHFPDTHILVRGDGHFGRPELMQMIDAMPNTDFIFGLPGNVKLQALAEKPKQRACELWVAVQTGDVVPDQHLLMSIRPVSREQTSRTSPSWPASLPDPTACG